MLAHLKLSRAFLHGVLLVALTLIAQADDSLARAWKPDARTAAQDYTQIVHHKSNTDVVIIWWLAPQFLSQDPQTAAFAKLLDDYVVIGIVEAHVAARTTFDPIDQLNVADGGGTILKALNNADMPAPLANGLIVLQRILTQSMGPMGQGIHWFVFDGKTVHSCGVGALAIAYGGELYTYETPIPGCPKI